MARKRKIDQKLQEYLDKIEKNMASGSCHSKFVLKLIKASPADKELILSAERTVYTKMRR